MKIETTKQSEEATLIIADRLEIEIQSYPTATYIRLIPHRSGEIFLNVADWQGQIHCMAVEAANQVVLEQIVNPASSNPDVPF